MIKNRMLRGTLAWLLAITLLLPALFSTVAAESNDRYLAVAAVDDLVFSQAVVVKNAGAVQVYTAAAEGDPQEAQLIILDSGDRRQYKLQFSGKAYNDSIAVWSCTESELEKESCTLEIGKPRSGEAVSVVLYNRNSVTLAESTISGASGASGSSAVLTLSESMSAKLTCAPVLNSNYQCVGMWLSDSTAYCSWFDEAAFGAPADAPAPTAPSQPTEPEQPAGQPEEPGEQPADTEPEQIAPAPGEDGESEIEEPTFWSKWGLVILIAGAATLTAAVVVVVLLIVRNNRKKKMAASAIAASASSEMYTAQQDGNPVQTYGAPEPEQQNLYTPPQAGNEMQYPLPDSGSFTTVSMESTMPGTGGYEPPANNLPPVSVPTMQLRLIADGGGRLSGKVFTMTGNELSIGRGVSENTVCFPPDTPGVSKRHAKIRFVNGKYYLIDVGSSYGTYLLGVQGKLIPNQPYEVSIGSVFYIAEKKNRFIIQD